MCQSNVCGDGITQNVIVDESRVCLRIDGSTNFVVDSENTNTILKSITLSE